MSQVALLIVDMLNAFDFDDPEPLIKAADKLVAPINALRSQARILDAPVIYVNDNYGRWHDERSDLLAWLTLPEARGRDIALGLAPRAEDYFVIKPEASGFYATTLPALLPRLGINSLVLTGVAAEMCVHFTAADAHMREYRLWVPSDAVAGTTPDLTQSALAIIDGSLHADTRPTTEVDLAAVFTHQWPTRLRRSHSKLIRPSAGTSKTT